MSTLHFCRFTAFSLLLAFASPAVVAQEIFDPHHFTGIQSAGTLPDDFLMSWSKKYQQKLESSEDEVESREGRKKLEAFWGTQYHMIDGMLQSGRFSFNDPITEYLNRIVDHLLKDDPELREEIRVYLYKSPSVNASAVADGIIMLYTGLFAHANTEAELAFVLAHEIAHYSEAHLLDRFNEREKVLKSKVKDYRDLNILQQMDLLTMRSQDHELEADEKGLELFLRSDYGTGAVESALTVMHESYLPFAREEVKHDFLSTSDFALPDIFFRDSVTPISREEDYFDDTHTHPNVDKRRKALEELMAKEEKSGGRDFLQSEELFDELRDLARFELVREHIIYGNYGRALYDIYVLEKEFGATKFLEVSKAKALYGLAGFKATNNYREVARSTSRVEGPSQQVHHVLRQFDSPQLVTIALHHLLTVQKEYPGEKYLQAYIDELSMHLVVNCKVSADDFKTETAALTPFSGTPEEYRSERLYLRARQDHYKDFYKHLMSAQYENGWLTENLQKHQWIVDSLDNERHMLAKDKRRREKQERRKLKRSGADLHIRKMIILDPTVVVQTERDDPDDLAQARKRERDFKERVPELASDEGIEPVLLYAEEMEASDIDKYRRFSALEEWITEAGAYYHYGLMPTSIDLLETEGVELPARYICRIVGHVVDNGRDLYYFTVFDLKKGEVVYQRKDDVGFRLSFRDLRKETAKDFERIYN